MRMLVLGAGAQGSSCAYDLLQNPEVQVVGLADVRVDSVAPFLAPYLGERLQTIALDVRETEAVEAVFSGYDAVMSALPYYFNLDVARIAVKIGVHFCDLGGNTEIVLEQKKLEEAARKKNISIIPDCGLAPGMVNILAQDGIDRLEKVDSVRMFVGGLPQHPEPPLNYQVVYSLEGAIDYYTTDSWILKGGKSTHVKALSEIEEVRFSGDIGPLEAFHTAGGLSTMAIRYNGKIDRMEYKTLRYPGHAKIMEAIRDLGLLDTSPIQVKGGGSAIPRDVSLAVMGRALTKPNSPDLVALRVVVSGTIGKNQKTVTYELLDYTDSKNGISAMMRATGYSLSITGQFQATGAIESGVHTPDECMPGRIYMDELRKRGIDIRVTED